MTHIEFRPTLNGAAQDPEAEGGQVSLLVLYPTPERAGSMVVEVGPATRVSFGVYAFDIPAAPPGRYYAAIQWRPDSVTETITDGTSHLDFPLRSDLLISAEDAACAAGVMLPITAEQREHLWTAIQDAQDAVVGAIGSITPTTFTQAGMWPFAADLSAAATWLDDPDRTAVILSAVPTDPADGTYTVTWRTGLDGASEGPILRYIRGHAAAYYAASPEGFTLARLPTSVAAEGQSVSYGSGSGSTRTATTTGPDLAALIKRYLSTKPKVFQRRGPPLMRGGPTEGAWYLRPFDDGPFLYADGSRQYDGWY